jgi:TrmH family RNA methyltransferase
MINYAQIRFVRSLEQKGVRDETGCFIAEGDKLVREALALPNEGPFQLKTIFGIRDWLDSNLTGTGFSNVEVIPVTERELKRLSLQVTPNQVLAVVKRKESHPPAFDFSTQLLIGLFQVQDPGNVGTIIRLADWFGLDGVIATADSADFYSPKVVQASMGSVFRIKLLAANLSALVKSLPKNFPVYGTHQDGQNIYLTNISTNGLILFGNESNGLSSELLAKTTKNLKIPEFALTTPNPQSLNVSIAAAIVCSEFRRRTIVPTTNNTN